MHVGAVAEHYLLAEVDQIENASGVVDVTSPVPSTFSVHFP